MKVINKIFIAYISALVLLVISAQVKAESGEAHHHGHSAQGSADMILNDGKKWQTDAALRQGMQRINDAVMNAADAYHHDALTQVDANKLSKTINEQVNYLIKNCKLEPKADATLHVLIGDFLGAAEKIKAEPLSSEGMPGAVKTLMAYPKYFDHPNWIVFK